MTRESNFPGKIGKWQGEIDGYTVERETSVTETANEKYIVTFTKAWKKGSESDSRFLSNEADRNS